VVQEYQKDYLEGRENRSAFVYILDSNGQVWQWGFQSFPYFGGPNVMDATFRARCFGFSGGLLIPLLLVFFFWIDKLKNLVRKIFSSPYHFFQVNTPSQGA
jgi:hypothetical protein